MIHADRDVIQGRCVDLGRDGLAIRSTRVTRSKHPVTLMLYLDGHALRVDAVLARRQRLHGDYIMGFAFVHLDAATRSQIERAMFDRLARSPEAELLLAFAAHVARPPSTLPTHGLAHGLAHGSADTRVPTGIEDRGDRTVVAAAGSIVPVVSGHTQVISMDRLAPDRTVIAPPPPRTDSTRVGFDPVAFEDSWFEDEMDTAEFYLLEATVEPEPDLVPRPEPTVAADSTVLAPLPEPDLVPRPAPTVAADSTVLAPLPELIREPAVAADSTVLAPLPELIREPAVAADSTVPVLASAPEPKPEPTVVVGVPASEWKAEPMIVTGDAGEPPTRAERTWVLAADSLAGVPEHVVPTHTPTAAMVLELDSPSAAGSVVAPVVTPVVTPVVGPVVGPDRTLPMRLEHSSPPSPPPLLRGEPGARATAESSPSSAPIVRPSQRALQEAMALLQRAAKAGHDPVPRRGPRVIVSIPHRTYRRRDAAPWNR